MAEPDESDIAAFVRKEWDRADLALAKERRDYWLNLAFMEGEQWVYWHPTSRTVAEFPRPNNDRVRLTANRMQPNLVNLMAKLTKRELAFEVLASEADDSALGGARLAEHLLEEERVEGLWEHVRQDAIHAAFLGGTSAVCVEWDANAGERLGDDEESGQTVNEGAGKLSALSIVEFTLEPGTRSWSDSRWWIMAKAMPPDQVRDHFGLDETPSADAQMGQGPLQRRLWQDRGHATNIDLTVVYTYYERPNKRNSKGRWVVVVNNQAVVDKPWPFKSNKLNLYPFRQIRLPQRWTGHTLMNDARTLQVAYNHGISMLSEHMKLAGNARLAIPDDNGIEATDLSDLPGELLYYNGQNSAGPHWINPPTIPRWLIDHVNRLEQKLDDTMAVHDISRGVAPGDRNSGLALSVLAEKDETPMGLFAHDQSQGWSYIGSFYLELLVEKVPEYRTATVPTEHGIPITMEWTGEMLHGQTKAHVPLDNVLPHSRVATQAWVSGMAQQFPSIAAQLASNPSALAKLMDIPSQALFGEVVDADVAHAQRENMLMGTGQIPSLGEKPFPMPFDNHAVHIAEHNRYRKGRAYQYASQQVRDIVDLHILAHETLAFEEAVKQAQANSVAPGAAAIPQADEPFGSFNPPDFAEQAGQMPGGPPAPMPAGI